MCYAKRILTLRDKLGISQRELAKKFGVSPGAVAHWEAGQRDISGPVEKLLEIFEQQLEDKYESGRSKKRRH